MATLEATGQEYVECLNTVNRDKSVYPEPNDFYLDLHMSQNRLPVQKIILGSVELPLTQWTIEEDWKNVYFDEGLRLIVTSDDNLDLVLFGIQKSDGTILLGMIPPSDNLIEQVTVVSATEAIFNTEHPHGLGVVDEWNWGQPIQITNTFLSPSLTLAGNPTLTIIDDTTFSVANIPPATPATNWAGIGMTAPNIGYVHAPPIRSPTDLARIVEKSLDVAADALSLPHWYKLEYTTDQNTFILNFIGGQEEDAGTLLIPGPNSLPYLMGMGGINRPLSNVIANEGSARYQCLSSICLDPGDYNDEEMVEELIHQWNRFWIDPTCSKGSGLDPRQFVFSDCCGVCHRIDIPFGMWTPETLASYLEGEMNTADPTGMYTVTVESGCGTTSSDFQFVIQSTVDKPFGLEFQDSGDGVKEFVKMIGFKDCCYRGFSSYRSPLCIRYPKAVCNGSMIPESYKRHIYKVAHQSKRRQFEFQSCTIPCLETELVSEDGMNAIFSSGALAHGLQVNDIVRVQFNGAAEEGPFTFLVTAVPDAFTFEVVIGSVTLPPTPFATTCTCIYDEPIFNLYFGPNVGVAPIRPAILGFCADAYYGFNSSPSTFILAPNIHELGQPPYILFLIKDPGAASTFIQHQYQGDNIPDVFAKVILLPFNLQRLYPMQILLQGIMVVTRLKIQILNPDHTLYHFHGKDWSATLTLITPTRSVNLNCY